ncbi:helix-turn-helix domain-containing protein [Collimonas sp.]|jgi:AcrR family transcriptional regulator|uniref:TetR/AcrR family transcriptional regulator n=1 Tax=Collimonas sp. TaxID=1963772 RepID=UPI002CE8A8D6|nr:helix-turn-helix domain-containing protein [Collimonas sp.]HWX02296.1 helix-turn-helix domain-containing protein [Collimonas sp.]
MTRMKEKRQILIDTATRLFSQDGYHAVGIDRILAEAGVAKMTLYKYFPSKKELVVEVLEERMTMCANSLSLFLEKFETPMDKLHGVFMWHDKWFREVNFTGCMFAAAAAEFHGSDNAILRTAASQKKGLTDQVKNVLEPLVGKTVATKLARQVVMLLDGATLAAHVAGRKNAANDAWSVAQEIVLLEHSKLQTA